MRLYAFVSNGPCGPIFARRGGCPAWGWGAGPVPLAESSAALGAVGRRQGRVVAWRPRPSW
eukprot:10497382-Lingulodinium_polyedra.AAC.1